MCKYSEKGRHVLLRKSSKDEPKVKQHLKTFGRILCLSKAGQVALLILTRRPHTKVIYLCRCANHGERERTLLHVVVYPVSRTFYILVLLVLLQVLGSRMQMKTLFVTEDQTFMRYTTHCN